MPIPWPLILYPRPKCVFSEAGLQWNSGWGRGVSSERGWEGVLSWLPWWGGGRGGLVLPRILVTCPGSQGTSCPCSLFMIRVEVPGSSFMLCLGPGPPSLLHLTRANAEKPYAGDTATVEISAAYKRCWRPQMLAAANVGVQTLTIWARQNLQLLTPSQSG